MAFDIEKLEWYGYPVVKILVEYMFTRFDKLTEYTNVTHGRTDGRTLRDGIGRAICIALRGKK